MLHTLPSIVRRPAFHLLLMVVALMTHPVRAGAVSPAPRSGPVMEYDAARSRMVMWGSLDPVGGDEGNLWALSLTPGQPSCWTALPGTPSGVAPVPSFRLAHCYDAIHDRILLFGGYTSDCISGGTPVNNQLAIKFTGPTSWQFQRINIAPGPNPGSRSDYSIIYDPGIRENSSSSGTPVGNRMILFGGRAQGSVTTGLSDCWQLQFNADETAGTWSQIPTPPSMPARWGHQAVYDPLRNRMIVFGGYTSDPQQFGMVKAWVLDLTGMQWTEQGINAPPPLPRVAFGATYNQENDEILVYSGMCFELFANPSQTLWYSDPHINTIQLYTDPLTMAWGTFTPAGTPAARASEAIGYDPAGDRMIVFGGYPATGPGAPFVPFCPGGSSDLIQGTQQVTRIQIPGMGWDYGQWSSISDCVPPDPGDGGDGGGGGGGGRFMDPAPSLRSTSNPMAGSTTLRFTLPLRSHVRLEIFDTVGRRVRSLLDADLEPGNQAVRWDGRDQAGNPVSRGVYVARLQGSFGTVQTKVTVVRSSL